MDFSEALKLLKGGAMVRRSGWNGKNQFLIYFETTTEYHDTDTWVKGNIITYYDRLNSFIAILVDVPVTGYNEPTKREATPWLPSQADLLAEDWALVEE